MSADHDHLNDLRELAPPTEPADPPAGAASTLEAISLIRGQIRWRDASAAARAIAKSWGDRPPADEPPPEPGR
jgi:hypothetical protein